MSYKNNILHMPALGVGTLIPDPETTITSVKYALEAGFRHFDAAERYRNESEVGKGLKEGLKANNITRNDIFVTTKLWNTNHRPERVEPALDASLERLQLDYVDLYLIHTPFAFLPGEEQDPRDKEGNIIYDYDITLYDTWKAMEQLVEKGKCKAIGLSDVNIDQLKEIYESSRIKPAAIQIESHPYLPETELLEYCKEKGITFLAFAPLGHGIKPGLLDDPIITEIAHQNNTTSAQVLLGWAVQRGTALLTTPKTLERAKENFNIAELSEEEMKRINSIETRQRYNQVVKTGSPGFIPKNFFDVKS